MTHRMAMACVVVGVAFGFLVGVAIAEPKVPGPLGLPSVETLKEKLTLSEAQTRKVETIYEEYKDKAKEVEEKGDDQKKADVRHEIVGKIKEVCSPNQKKMLDQIVSEKAK